MKKTITTISVSLLALLLMLSPTVAAASTPQTLVLNIFGQFDNIAQQQLQMRGGTLQPNSYITMGSAQLPLTPAGSRLTFSLQAQVTGVTTSGHSGNGEDGGDNDNGWHGNGHQANTIQVSGFASFDVQASTGAGNLEISGSVNLNDMVAAVGLPLVSGDTTGLACFATNSCTSAIPAFFVGDASISIQAPSQHGQNTHLTIPMLFESAYMNPAGAYSNPSSAPIVIESADALTGVPAIQIITTYTSADSTWSGVVVSGNVMDPSGTTIGQFSQTASLQESLFKGTETDQGTLNLFGFTAPYSVLNSKGTFQGTSTIPLGGIDCSSTQGAPNPFPPGTCLETGSISIGTFNLTSTAPGSLNKQITGRILGQYQDYWFVPAIAFAGVVEATVTSG